MELSKSSLAILISVVVIASIIIIPTNSMFSKHDVDIGIDDLSDFKLGKDKSHFRILKGLEKKYDEMVLDRVEMVHGLSYFDTDLISQLPGINPDVVTYRDKILIVYEHVGGYKNITMQYSRDHGRNWSSALFSPGPELFNYPFKRSNQTDPDIAIKPNGYAICVFESDDNNSRLYMLEFPNITDSSSWKVSWIDLYYLEGKLYSYRISNLHDLAIDIADNNRILIAGVGDITNLSSGITLHQAPVIFYSNDGGDKFTIIFSEDTPYRNLQKTSVSFDVGAFVTYQIANEGILCLYFPDGDFDKDWEEFDLEDRDLTQYRNPSVYTWESNVVIVLESVSYNNSDIAYFYSQDLGSNWSPGTIDVACSSENEKYPCIIYQQDKFMISFEKDGNLYITNSTDFETWSDPEKVNEIDGSIYPYFGFSEFGNEYGIVWSEIEEDIPVVKFSDMRKEADENEDYVDLRITGNITFKSSEERIVKNMKNVLSIEIENTGSMDSDSFLVTAYIKYKNKERLNPIAVKNVGGLKKGERVEVNLTLFYPSLRDVVKALVSFVNVDSIVIKVDSDDSIAEKDESNNNITIDVSYGTFFPKLVWVEDMILRIVEGRNLNSESVEELVVNMLSDELS